MSAPDCPDWCAEQDVGGICSDGDESDGYRLHLGPLIGSWQIWGTRLRHTSPITFTASAVDLELDDVSAVDLRAQAYEAYRVASWLEEHQ